MQGTQLRELTQGVVKALEGREVIKKDPGDTRGYSADETTLRLLEIYTGLELLQQISSLTTQIRDHAQMLRNKL